uniref:Uncharacterized protein n=1 Tax=Rhizophora mucronata TaxID=61149 RepID=A0A2P2JE35_RHIMU
MRIIISQPSRYQFRIRVLAWITRL